MMVRRVFVDEVFDKAGVPNLSSSIAQGWTRDTAKSFV
jgi:hypothetical protein